MGQMTDQRRAALDASYVCPVTMADIDAARTVANGCLDELREAEARCALDAAPPSGLLVGLVTYAKRSYDDQIYYVAALLAEYHHDRDRAAESVLALIDAPRYESSVWGLPPRTLHGSTAHMAVIDDARAYANKLLDMILAREEERVRRAGTADEGSTAILAGMDIEQSLRDQHRYVGLLLAEYHAQRDAAVQAALRLMEEKPQ